MKRCLYERRPCRVSVIPSCTHGPLPGCGTVTGRFCLDTRRRRAKVQSESERLEVLHKAAQAYTTMMHRLKDVPPEHMPRVADVLEKFLTAFLAA
jgi:hypothetical protein